MERERMHNRPRPMMTKAFCQREIGPEIGPACIREQYHFVPPVAKTFCTRRVPRPRLLPNPRILPMHGPMSATTSRCRRCGACCRAGGPTLHQTDLPLLRRGILDLTDLWTLRPGEWVTDNVAGGVGPSPVERIKILPGPDGRTCRFFQPGAPPSCAIHRDRPAQCRALFCQRPQAVVAMYQEDLLSRGDILGHGGPLAALCAHHEAEIALARLDALCRRALTGDAGARDAVGHAVRLDAALRELAGERAHLPDEALLFFFGRPPREALPACRAVLAGPPFTKTGPGA